MNEPMVNSGRLRTYARLGAREVCCDGVNANTVWDGFERRILGIRPPTDDFSAADSMTAGSVAAGDHLIGVTFAIVKAGVILVESNVKSLITVTSTGGKKIDITNLPVSDNDSVTSRVIYMSAAGSSELFRITLEETVSDNTTTTYSIDISDDNLTAIALSYANEFIPAKPFVSEHNNRLMFWGDVPWSKGTVDATNGDQTLTFHDATLTRAMEGKAIRIGTDTVKYEVDSIDVDAQTAHITVAYGGTTVTGATYIMTGNATDLIFSNALPENIEGYDISDPNSIIIVRGDDCDEPTGIMSLRDLRFLGKKSHLYMLDGSAPANYEVKDISDNIGLASPCAWDQDDNGALIFYAGAQGVMVIFANLPHCISKPLMPIFANGINHALDYKTHAKFYPAKKQWLLWTCRTGETILDRVLAADTRYLNVPDQNERRVAWWEFRLPASYSRMQTLGSEKRLLLGNYWGQIVAWDSGFTDGAETVTQIGTLTGVSGDTLTDSDADWDEDTTGRLSGVPITFLTGTAKGQTRYILTNTVTTLTIDSRSQFLGSFAPVPSVGDTYILGHIPWYWVSPDLNARSLSHQKNFYYNRVLTHERLSDEPDFYINHEAWTEYSGRMAYRGLQRLRPNRASEHHVKFSGARANLLRLKLSGNGSNLPAGFSSIDIRAEGEKQAKP